MLRDARRILSIAVCLAIAPTLGIFPASNAAADTVDGQFDKTGALAGGVVLNLTIAGRGGVPLSGVASVALNVTAVNPTSGGFIDAGNLASAALLPRLNWLSAFHPRLRHPGRKTRFIF